MFKRNQDGDFVFNLSLAEVAFIIILALVLLLGYPLTKKNEELEALDACRLLKSDLSEKLTEAESLLLPCDRCVANKRKIPIEEARHIRELGEVAHEFLESNDKTKKYDIKEILQAWKKVKSQEREINKLNKIVDDCHRESDQLKEKVKDLSKNEQKLQKELLRYKNKAEYGRDFPPCMQGVTRKSDGTPFKWDNLFVIRMFETRVFVDFASNNIINHPAIDENLRQLANKVVNISREKNGLTWKEFDAYMSPIYTWSQTQLQPCYLAVMMENRIKNRKEGDKRRMENVENRFLKEERKEK